MLSKDKNKFLNIKKAENFGSDYYYAERLGKDSIAFVLVNTKNYDSVMYGLIREFKPPINEFMVTAFGGSLDKTHNIVETVITEVKEESGYIVTPQNCDYKGKFFVSSQMNQFCHLFEVYVTDAKLGGKQPDSKGEEMAEVVWIRRDDIDTLDCWKARLIVGM